jgi:hypothetical protein
MVFALLYDRMCCKIIVQQTTPDTRGARVRVTREVCDTSRRVSHEREPALKAVIRSQ